MKESKKALLLSLLGFPGLGHFYLKRYVPAIAISAVVAVSFYVLTAYAYERAQSIADKLVNGTIPFDLVTILALIREAPSAEDAGALSMAQWAFVLVWLLAAVDVYRIGKGAQRNKAAH